MSDRCDLLCLDLERAEEVRACAPPAAELERAARVARALGDPTRLGVAAALSRTDELCGCDLAWVLGRAPNLVSHHLKALRTAGLVGARRAGKTVFFSLTPAGRAAVGDLLGAQAPA